MCILAISGFVLFIPAKQTHCAPSWHTFFLQQIPLFYYFN